MTAAGAAVPSDVDGLTAQWLTAELGAPVVAVEIERIAQDSGFSSLLYRVHLTGEPACRRRVIVKLPAQSEARGAMEMLGGYRRELAFYQHVAGRAPMETPHVYAARMVDGTADFVLVLEDLQDWDNADHLAGLSMDRARIVHRRSWPACTRGRSNPANAAVLEAFPEHRHPDRPRPARPGVRAGLADLSASKSSAPVPAAVARVRRAVRRARAAGAGRR